MTAKDCITNRRSIRQFLDKPVDHQVLADVVSLASYAPSWKNTQITSYIAVEGEKKAQLAQCISTYANNGKIMENAPVVIAVVIKKGRCGFERDGSYSTNRGDSWQMFDAGLACEAFCLAAHEQGLGTVILGLFDQEKASSLLSIPEDMELVTLIPLGYPAESPAAPKRKTVSELLTYM